MLLLSSGGQTQGKDSADPSRLLLNDEATGEFSDPLKGASGQRRVISMLLLPFDQLMAETIKILDQQGFEVDPPLDSLQESQVISVRKKEAKVSNSGEKINDKETRSGEVKKEKKTRSVDNEKEKKTRSVDSEKEKKTRSVDSEKDRVTRSVDDEKNKKTRSVDGEKDRVTRSVDGEKDKKTRSVDGEKDRVTRSVDGEKDRVTRSVDGEKDRVTRSVDGEKDRVTRSVDGEKDRVTRSVDGEKDRVTRSVDGEKDRVTRSVDGEKDRVTRSVENVKDSEEDDIFLFRLKNSSFLNTFEDLRKKIEEDEEKSYSSALLSTSNEHSSQSGKTENLEFDGKVNSQEAVPDSSKEQRKFLSSQLKKKTGVLWGNSSEETEDLNNSALTKVQSKVTMGLFC